MILRVDTSPGCPNPWNIQQVKCPVNDGLRGTDVVNADSLMLAVGEAVSLEQRLSAFVSQFLYEPRN